MFFITSTQMSHVDMIGDKSLFNEPLFYTFIRGYFTTNLRTCVLRLVVLKKPLTEMITLMSLPMCQRLWYGCWWSWDVTIHNLRTVAPRYGELLALLVYLTWDSLWSGAIDTKLEMGRWAMLRSSYRRIRIVIKTASNFPVFVIAVHSAVAHNHG